MVGWIGINVLRIFAASFFSLSTSVLRFSHIAVVMIEGKPRQNTKYGAAQQFFLMLARGVEQVKLSRVRQSEKMPRARTALQKFLSFFLLSLFVDFTD